MARGGRRAAAARSWRGCRHGGLTWKLESGIAQLTNLSHVGIAVKDAEKTAGAVSGS